MADKKTFKIPFRYANIDEIPGEKIIPGVDEIAAYLLINGDTILDTSDCTIQISQSHNGFDLRVYPLGTRPNMNNDFEYELMIDDKYIDTKDEYKAAQYIFEYKAV